MSYNCNPFDELSKVVASTATTTEAINLLRDDGMMLEYITEQTSELCFIAVTQNYRALQFVKEQTHDVCLTAIKQDWRAMEFVKNKTPEICFEAVKQTRSALEFVEETSWYISCVDVINNWR